MSHVESENCTYSIQDLKQSINDLVKTHLESQSGAYVI